MTRLLTYLAAFVITLMGVQTAAAANSRAAIRCSSRQPAKVELTCGYRSFYQARHAIRSIRNHRERELASAHHSSGYWRWRERVDRGWIAQAHNRLALLSYPPHHALWMCEHSFEAGDWNNQNTGGNGHWGGLQMTPNWGMWLRNGVLVGYGLRGYASDYTQLQQEWAAERGFRANDYSTTWLLEQWYHPSCLTYAG